MFFYTKFFVVLSGQKSPCLLFLTAVNQCFSVLTHPCSESYSQPLLGYTTQLMSGLSWELADSRSGSTTVGEQQLTPTASSCADLLATCTASAKGEPSEMCFSSWRWFKKHREAKLWPKLNSRQKISFSAVTLQEKDSQALESGNSVSSSTTALASLMLGIVSKARRSAPAANKPSTCGRCQSFSSYDP